MGNAFLTSYFSLFHLTFMSEINLGYGQSKINFNFDENRFQIFEMNGFLNSFLEGFLIP